MAVAKASPSGSESTCMTRASDFAKTAGASDPKVMEAILQRIPIGRLGEPKEAAQFTMSLLNGHLMSTLARFKIWYRLNFVVPI
jgi:hypothetical protein